MPASPIALKNSLPQPDLNPGWREYSARQASRHCGLFNSGLTHWATETGSSIDSATAYQISLKSDHMRKSYDGISIFQDGSRRVTNTSGFGFSGDTHLRSKSICRPNFDEIFQSIAEWLPLPISKNKWPPYWNSTSDFDFYLFIVISMSYCIGLPNVIEIGPSAVELWCHINFSRWRPSAMLHLVCGNVDHPWRVIVGLNYVLKISTGSYFRRYCDFWPCNVATRNMIWASLSVCLSVHLSHLES